MQLLVAYEACLEALASKAEAEAPLDVARTGRVRKQVSCLTSCTHPGFPVRGAFQAAGLSILSGLEGQQGQIETWKLQSSPSGHTDVWPGTWLCRHVSGAR